MSKITNDPTGLLFAAAAPRRDAGGASTEENRSDFADRLAEAAADGPAAAAYADDAPAEDVTPNAEDAAGGGSDELNDRGDEQAGGERKGGVDDSEPEQLEESPLQSADETLVVIIGAEPTPVVAATPVEVSGDGATSVATVGLAIEAGEGESDANGQGANSSVEFEASSESIDADAVLETDPIDVARETESGSADPDRIDTASPVEPASTNVGEVALGSSSSSREASGTTAPSVEGSANDHTAAAEAFGDRASGGEAGDDRAQAPKAEGAEGEPAERPAASESLGQTVVETEGAADGPVAEASLAEEVSSSPTADASSHDASEARPTESAPSGRAADASEPLARIAAGRLASARADQAEAKETPRVDASRFVSRVSRAVESAQQRGGEIRIRLSPPELGALQIKLSLNEGVMTASLETETNAARNVLLDNLPALRERLAEQEIQIEKFDVDVRDEGRQTRDNAADERDRRQADRGGPTSRQAGAANTESSEAAARSESDVLPATNTPDAINVVA